MNMIDLTSYWFFQSKHYVNRIIEIQARTRTHSVGVSVCWSVIECQNTLNGNLTCVTDMNMNATAIILEQELLIYCTIIQNKWTIIIAKVTNISIVINIVRFKTSAYVMGDSKILFFFLLKSWRRSTEKKGLKANPAIYINYLDSNGPSNHNLRHKSDNKVVLTKGGTKKKNL